MDGEVARFFTTYSIHWLIDIADHFLKMKKFIYSIAEYYLMFMFHAGKKA